MAKERFNEAQRWLIQNWAKAHLLEDAMDTVRKRYAEICTDVVDAVQDKHPELDWSHVYVSRETGKGGIGIGRKAWPCYYNWRVGFYVEGLRLELLASEAGDRPNASIWPGSTAIRGLDPRRVDSAIHAAKPRLLAKHELRRCGKDEQFWYYVPDAPKQLIDMLMDGDGRRFVDCIAAHFDLLARFTPVLDKVVAKPSRAK